MTKGFSGMNLFRATFMNEHGAYETKQVYGVSCGKYWYTSGERGTQTLTHKPSGFKLATLNTQRECKALAKSLNILQVNWSISDPVYFKTLSAPILQGIAKLVRAAAGIDSVETS